MIIFADKIIVPVFITCANTDRIYSMLNFTQEGLFITPEGYFMSRWNSELRLYESEQLVLSQIETRLNDTVSLLGDVRLKHIFEPLLGSQIMEAVFRRNGWKTLMHEIMHTHWMDYPGDVKAQEDLDGEDIHYTEVYEVITYEATTNTLEMTSGRYSFHGISYPISTQAVADKMYSKIGDIIPWSLSAEPLAKYMNYPIRIGKISIYKQTDYMGNEAIIENATGYMTLNTLLHSILWDMSFYGVGETRDNFSKFI